MRRHNFVMGGLALLAALSLSACTPGLRPASATSDDDTGQVHVAQAAPSQPTSYTTQAGDTLVQVAARPEVYGDPDLWPLLKDANAESLGLKTADSPLDADLVLEIPRDSPPEALESARSRAHQFAAQQKALAEAKEKASLRESEVPAQRGENSVAMAAKQKRAAVTRASAPEARPTVVAAAPVASPAPAHKSRMLPLYLLLLLVLAALAAVFFVFFRRDKQDFE